MADAMAAAIRASRVQHVVFLSAAMAVLPDGNGPAKDLHYAEQALRAAAPKLTVIRAGYFQENVLGALEHATREGIYPNFLPTADLSFPTVATRDIGRLAARLLSEPAAGSETLDLLGPSYSIRDMAGALGRALGKALRVVDIPAAAHVQTLTKAGLPEPFAVALAEMFASFASGRLSLRGDRVERGTTELDEVLGQALRSGARAFGAAFGRGCHERCHEYLAFRGRSISAFGTIDFEVSPRGCHPSAFSLTQGPARTRARV
jgi:uncharacterized protein YbjT (DUF2867 family)